MPLPGRLCPLQGIAKPLLVPPRPQPSSPLPELALSLCAGHKRWALFPPGTPKALLKPPGVEREAATWFAKVYPATRRPDWPAAKPIDVIQVREGRRRNALFCVCFGFRGGAGGESVCVRRQQEERGCFLPKCCDVLREPVLNGIKT